jgi:hypothetical protein
MSRQRRSGSWWIAVSVILLLLLAIAVSACSLGAGPTATPVIKEVVKEVPKEVTKIVQVVVTATPAAAAAAPTAVGAKAPSAELIASVSKAWESGPHNNKYDLYKGPNTYCAVCHSPQNWDPKATVNVAPNCFSCKFPTDKEVRISPKAPLIEEKDWKKVNCSVCHPTGTGPKIAAWNNGTKSYDAVASSSALCAKCHVDSLAGTGHQITMGGGAHSNQMGTTTRRPWECTECHDEHSMKADCKTCHAKSFAADTKTAGHDAAHAKVTCTACHDASGAKAAPVEAKGGLWYTQFTSVSAASGRVSTTAGYSHDFAKAVACTRCHYKDNPWKLRNLEPTPTPVRTGTPAPAVTPAPSPTK